MVGANRPLLFSPLGQDKRKMFSLTWNISRGRFAPSLQFTGSYIDKNFKNQGLHRTINGVINGRCFEAIEIAHSVFS